MIDRLGSTLARLLLPALFGVGCTVTNTSADTAAPPAIEAPASGDPVPQPATGETSVTGCTSNADCGDGICEGEGCGEVLGTCVSKNRMCTRDSQPYCGCDQIEFRASGSCPNARYAHKGRCERAQPKPE